MIAKLTKSIATRRYFCATVLLCCAGIAALFATHALAAEAYPSAGNVASATLAALPQGGSFPDGVGVGDQRVPLSSTAARMGVIVVVSGEDIHITRPDGTESRLRGRASKAALPRRSDDPAPVIRDGEAWVRPNDVLALLAPSGSEREATPKSRPAKPTQTTAGFETFEVQKPVVAAPEPPKTLLRQPRARLAPGDIAEAECHDRAVGVGHEPGVQPDHDTSRSRFAGFLCPELRRSSELLREPAWP